jgi:hypothetical protein
MGSVDVVRQSCGTGAASKWAAGGTGGVSKLGPNVEPAPRVDSLPEPC